MTSRQYQQASERFLAQASEKGWGATPQMLKAIAEQRGWEHHRHRHYHRAAIRILAETGDGEISRLFDSASALHENFYENDMETDEVAERLDDVEALMDKLIPLLG